MRLSGFPGGSDGKESAYSAGDLGSIPRLGRSPGGGSSDLLQYSCLENSMQGGAWWATVHGVPKSRAWLSDFLFFFFSPNVSRLTKATKRKWKLYLILKINLKVKHCSQRCSFTLSITFWPLKVKKKKKNKNKEKQHWITEFRCSDNCLGGFKIFCP